MTNAVVFTSLCPGCFANKGNASLCPHCGYDESLKRGPLVLAHRTLLHHGQYLIGRVLGKPGGFGITYLALDTKLETRVAIKEYLPRDLAGRDAGHATISAHSAEDGEFFRYGLIQFLQEARTLAQFDHANIVRVRNFFEENSTGYLVMDYYDGVTLADYLAQQPQGRLPEKTAVAILMPILDGLREVHAKNFLHRDIKPQNIYLTTGNRPILLDFGAARQAMGERSRSLSVVLSEGYAPYEQYHRRGEQGPWTDIYACAAVLYHAVAGEAPPPATERVHKDELDIAASGLSASLTNALRLGLAADHANRPQRMTEFQALLLGNGELKEMEKAEQNTGKIKPTAPAKIVAPNPIEPTKGKGPSFLTMLFRLALAVVIVIGVLVVFMSGEMKTVQTAAPTLASHIGIEMSDLSPVQKGSTVLQLTAVIKNRADIELKYPALELTLTDATDQAVVRRILLARDFLNKNVSQEFAANGTLNVSLKLEAPGISASGYRLYVFYPSDEPERMKQQLKPELIKLFSVSNEAEMKPATAADGQHPKAESVTYKEERKSVERFAGRPSMETTVVALINGKRLEVPGDNCPVDLIVQKDFNGDGVMDALISITRLCGGSGEWEETMFVTVADGKIVTVPVAGGKIVEEGGRFLIKSESDDATEYFGFDGQKAIMVRSVPHRKLAAIVEFRTKGGLNDNEVETLDADLDMDGKSDRITCHIWQRRAVVTSCILPLPGGRTEEIKLSCGRVGVLNTLSNGYRELVCNNNAVIRFDGKGWVQLKPAP